MILVSIIGFSIIITFYLYITNRKPNTIHWENIDHDIRPLLKTLHAFGIETYESCSGHGKEGYIEIAPTSYKIEYDDLGKQYLCLILNPKHIAEFNATNKKYEETQHDTTT